MGNRIVIEVEAHVGRLGGGRRFQLVGGERRFGQHQEVAAFRLEGRLDRHGRVFRTAPLAGRALGPGPGLGVQLVQAGETAIAATVDGFPALASKAFGARQEVRVDPGELCNGMVAPS